MIVPQNRIWGAMAAVGATVLVVLVLHGCSSVKETAAGGEGSVALLSPSEEFAHQAAVQHFIDGSIFELKEEYAKAILEYQDALRYEKNAAVYFALSKDYSALGKNALAIESGREAIRRAPDNIDYRRTLAQVYVGAFEVDSACAQFEEIIRRDSSDLEAWYNLARLYQPRKPLKALGVYQAINERFGPEWEVLYQIADLCNKLGRYDSAATALKQMTGIDPGNQELKRSLGQTYLRVGKTDDALAVFKGLRDMDPDNLEYVADVASVYLAQKDYGRAAKTFEPILDRDTVAIELKLRIGELYFDQMEKDSTIAPYALSIFGRIRDAHPDDWRPYWFLGAIGSVTRNDSLAVNSFRKVTELASWNADGWVNLSIVFLGKSDFTKAIDILESALRVLPDDFRVNFYLGLAYTRAERNADAARVLEHARAINPKDIDAISQLALVYDGMKRYEDSDNLYEQALAVNPDNDLVLNNYAYSLADRGLQLERARTMAKRAVEAKPDNPSYLDTMGWVYFRLGEFAEAESFVKKAMDQGEVSAVVFEHLGDIYYKMNKRAAALEQWNAALQRDKNNAALRDKIARGSL